VEPPAADVGSRTPGANRGGVFTSDLSVSEYVLLGEARELAVRVARTRFACSHTRGL